MKRKSQAEAMPGKEKAGHVKLCISCHAKLAEAVNRNMNLIFITLKQRKATGGGGRSPPEPSKKAKGGGGRSPPEPSKKVDKKPHCFKILCQSIVTYSGRINILDVLIES